MISGSYAFSREGGVAAYCWGAMVEKRETLGVVDGRVLRVLGKKEALEHRREDGAAIREAPRVRGDLLVSRLNAEPVADMMNNAGRDCIPRDKTEGRLDELRVSQKEEGPKEKKKKERTPKS